MSSHSRNTHRGHSKWQLNGRQIIFSNKSFSTSHLVFISFTFLSPELERFADDELLIFENEERVQKVVRFTFIVLQNHGK